MLFSFFRMGVPTDVSRPLWPSWTSAPTVLKAAPVMSLMESALSSAASGGGTNRKTLPLTPLGRACAARSDGKSCCER